MNTTSNVTHTAFLADWKAKREIKANTRAARKQAFLASKGGKADGSGRDSSTVSKESFEYPALSTETATQREAIAYCNAMERAEKVSGVNLIALLTKTFALGVKEGAEAKVVELPKKGAQKDAPAKVA
jgi:hypothetical protein